MEQRSTTPWGKIAVLALGAFVIGADGFMLAAVLPQVAQQLGGVAGADRPLGNGVCVGVCTGSTTVWHADGAAQSAVDLGASTSDICNW